MWRSAYAKVRLVQVLTCYAVEGTKEGDNKENGGGGTASESRLSVRGGAGFSLR